MPESKEKNANLKLVEFGATPLSMNGQTIEIKTPVIADLFELTTTDLANEPISAYNDNRNIETEINSLLKKGEYTSKEIMLALRLDWDSRKLTDFLKKNPNVKADTSKPPKYSLNENITPSLFD